MCIKIFLMYNADNAKINEIIAVNAWTLLTREFDLKNLNKFIDHKDSFDDFSY